MLKPNGFNPKTVNDVHDYIHRNDHKGFVVSIGGIRCLIPKSEAWRIPSSLKCN